MKKVYHMQKQMGNVNREMGILRNPKIILEIKNCYRNEK